MSTPSTSKFQVNGLLVFATAMVTVLMVVAVGGNVLFERFADEPSIPAAEPLLQTPVSQATAAVSLATPSPSASPNAVPAVVHNAFAPPDESAMPKGEYGKVIRLGQRVFMETGKYAGPYVGNNLSRTSRNQTSKTKPRLYAGFLDVQPIYVPANVLG